MTNLEITKLCAEAMGYKFVRVGEDIGRTYPEDKRRIHVQINDRNSTYPFSPLITDAQAMQLVRKFITVIKQEDLVWICCSINDSTGSHQNINHAICEAVAKMQGRHD